MDYIEAVRTVANSKKLKHPQVIHSHTLTRDDVERVLVANKAILDKMDMEYKSKDGDLSLL